MTVSERLALELHIKTDIKTACLLATQITACVWQNYRALCRSSQGGCPRPGC
jgi:hypothetical protein